MLKQIKGEGQSATSSTSALSGAAPQAVGSEDDSGEYEHVTEDVSEEETGTAESDEAELEAVGPASSTRSKARQRRKA